MRDLKDLDGRKLGRNVREHIASVLEKRGLGFVGEGASFNKLPARETDTVRIYIRPSQIGSVIEAVVLRGSAGDRRLRAIISDDDSASKLHGLTNRLRELIAVFDPEAF
jgi:hypothetical protein